MFAPTRMRPAPAIDATRAPWTLWRRWVLAMMLGELVGFVAPALVGPITAPLPGLGGALIAIVALALAGGVEGSILAYAQWTVLRRVAPSLPRRVWIRNTALLAALAWAAGMALGNLSALASGGTPPATGGAQPAEPPLWAVLLAASGMGLAAGALLGWAQWLALRAHLRDAGWWILANAIGWAAGLAVCFLGIGLIRDGMPLWLEVAIGVASGVAMGATAAALTGVALVRLAAAHPPR